MIKKLIIRISLLALIAVLLVSYPSFANNTQIAAEVAQVEEINSSGTEPFWSVTVNKSGIVYSSPSAKKQTFPYVTPLSAAGRTPDTVRVYRLRGGNHTLVIKKQSACSNGMSDKEYPYSATFIMNNTVLDGCAESK
jgi:uncharacterized membrane protein